MHSLRFHALAVTLSSLTLLAACGLEPDTQASVRQPNASAAAAAPDAGAPLPASAPAPTGWADLSGRWTMTLTLEPRLVEQADGGLGGRTLPGRGTARLPVELRWQDGAWRLEAFATDGSAATVVAPRLESSTASGALTASLPRQHVVVLPRVNFTLSAGGMSVDYAPDYAMFIRLLDASPAELVSANRLRFARVAADTTEGFSDQLPTAVGADPAVYFLTVELVR